jgi:hypothetical protein
VEQSNYAVGWGTLALINAGLAQSRRRSGGNWFLLSLLLGPIATLLLVTAYREPDDAGARR